MLEHKLSLIAKMDHIIGVGGHSLCSCHIAANMSRAMDHAVGGARLGGCAKITALVSNVQS